MKFVIKHDPIAQCRPRMCGSKVYDPLSEVKKNLKWDFVSQMRNTPFQRLQDRPIAVEMDLYTPIAASLSEDKRSAFVNDPHDIMAPDVDNYAKFYLDTMNRIVYEDDRSVSRLWVEKRKSLNPRAEIFVYPLGVNMINEHAITLNGEITPADLEYLVRKANKIGKQGREIVRVYSQEDSEGKHVYFECDALKERFHE